MNQVISLTRIKNLIRKDIFQLFRAIPILTGAVMGILILGNIVQGFLTGGEPIDSTLEAIQNLLAACGLIAASYAFQELHNKDKCEDYILLPASTFEKTFTRFVLVSILIPIYIIAMVMVSEIISRAVNALAFDLPFELYNPFNAKLAKFLSVFLVIQQVAFLGAAWFKKLHLLKTILACIVLAVVFGLLAFLVIRIMFFNIAQSEMVFGMGQVARMMVMKYFDVLGGIGQVIFYSLLAPFCWVVAWMRVKEVQSYYGV